MAVSSVTEHWIKQGALTIILNHFGDPDYLQVSLLAGTVVMAYKSGVIDYNAAHDFRTWPLEAANTYLETTSAYNVYARLTRTEVNARGLIVYDPALRDIEGREIIYRTNEETGLQEEVLGEVDADYFYMYLGQISASVDTYGVIVPRTWTVSYISGSLDTDQYRGEESEADWTKMFRLNKVTDMIEVLKIFTSGIFKKLSIKNGDIEKEVTDVRRSIDTDESVPVSDTSVPTTKYIQQTTEEKFLRKDKEDTAEKVITFIEGLKTKEAVWSLLTGKGTIIKDGIIQADKLELRGALVAMQLLINEIQGIAGDQVYSDVGNVTAVELVDTDTYKLTIEKKTDYDFTTLQENDIIKQIVNTMVSGGTDYYISWSRVLTTNVNDNTITVVLYSGVDCPGGVNYAPVADYNVMRAGNAVIPDDGATNERANYWTLSSREGRIQFLQNVFKPILEDYNYALTVGKLPDIEAIRNLPVLPNEDVGIVAKTVIAEHFYNFDYNGDIVSNKVDRGEWSLEVAQSEKPYRYVQHERLYPDGTTTYTELEQHTVWHYGCKWGCLSDNTTDEPVWNSASWVLLEGDKNYYMIFDSSNGFQFTSNNMDTVITAMVSYGNRDITDVLMASTGIEVEWLRDTGDTASDNAWLPTYVGDAKHIIRLTRSDMGAGWMTSYRVVKFTCRVAIPYGDDYELVENTINYKL